MKDGSPSTNAAGPRALSAQAPFFTTPAIVVGRLPCSFLAEVRGRWSTTQQSVPTLRAVRTCTLTRRKETRVEAQARAVAATTCIVGEARIGERVGDDEHLVLLPGPVVGSEKSPQVAAGVWFHVPARAFDFKPLPGSRRSIIVHHRGPGTREPSGHRRWKSRFEKRSSGGRCRGCRAPWLLRAAGDESPPSFFGRRAAAIHPGSAWRKRPRGGAH